MSKAIAVAVALAAVAAMMEKLNGTYGSLNSQDADFKNLKVEVDSALALPDDPVASNTVTMGAAEAAAAGEKLSAWMERVDTKIDGMEDGIAYIVAAIPATAPAAPAETAPA